MADTDSFIDEVTEELRRDKLFMAFRRYGWIAVLAVLVLVGGAITRELLIAQNRATAEAVGDQMLAALRQGDPATRAATLQVIDGTGDARVIVALLAAATDLEADERSAAIEALNSIALDADLPRRYRDLAALKSVMLSAGETAASERLIALTPLAQPGAPYRVLAAEQIALAEAEIGNTDAAIAQLQALMDDQEATPGLRRRVSDAIVALGGAPDQER